MASAGAVQEDRTSTTHTNSAAKSPLSRKQIVKAAVDCIMQFPNAPGLSGPGKKSAKIPLFVLSYTPRPSPCKMYSTTRPQPQCSSSIAPARSIKQMSAIPKKHTDPRNTASNLEGSMANAKDPPAATNAVTEARVPTVPVPSCLEVKVALTYPFMNAAAKPKVRLVKASSQIFTSGHKETAAVTFPHRDGVGPGFVLTTGLAKQNTTAAATANPA
mmetsp:Transcript_117/g.318  ORF Transcript_117/g.318 Transcript_117/m.318 type:complete len:216 (-) Transcript_117:710-1357(-)